MIDGAYEILMEIYRFDTRFQMICTSIEDRRNVWPSYTEWSRYHITVYQVTTATHAVQWLTQMFQFDKCKFKYHAESQTF